MSKKEDMTGQSFKKCDITLALNGSENVNLNIERLADYKMPSVEEAYELQLKSELFSCEEEQENI